MHRASINAAAGRRIPVVVSWKAVFSTTFLAILAMAACSRQPAIKSLDESGSDHQQLPFERAPNRRGIPPAAMVAIPEIPARTPLIIRLQSPLSSAFSRAGESFVAVLDEGVVIEGKTVFPSGTMMAGRVVDAGPADGLHPGYLRLTLFAIALDGKAQAIQTSSMFVKGGSPQSDGQAAGSGARSRASGPKPGGEAGNIEFSTGSRLTFHLQKTLPRPS
jgi:hypothetical protein